jgi:uncharacterized protein (TIGR00369 family)
MGFEVVRELIQNIPLNQTMGIRIEDAAAGSAVATMAERPEYLNHIGTPHAAALFALAEAASGACVGASFFNQMGAITPLAKEGTIRYRKVARGALRASAKLAQPVGEIEAALAASDKGVETRVLVELANEQGELTTELEVVWFLKKRRDG